MHIRTKKLAAFIIVAKLLIMVVITDLQRVRDTQKNDACCFNRTNQSLKCVFLVVPSYFRPRLFVLSEESAKSAFRSDVSRAAPAEASTTAHRKEFKVAKDLRKHFILHKLYR